MDIALFSPISGLGKLALALGCIAAVVAASWIVRRHRRANRSAFWLATLVAVFGTCGTAAVVNVMEEGALELNPTFSVEHLAGTWIDGGAVLELGRDGSYSCAPRTSCGDLTAAGRWSRREDFDVVLRPADGGSITRRVIIFSGAFRLTQMEDIDGWNRELTFKHLPSGS